METTCADIIALAEKVIAGGEITEEEAKRLVRVKDEDTMLLLAMADKIRQRQRRRFLRHSERAERSLPGGLQILRPVGPL